MTGVMNPTAFCVESTAAQAQAWIVRFAGRASMYVSDHDPSARVAQWQVRGPLSQLEWTQHLADMDLVASWPRDSVRACVLIRVADFAPTATQRAEIALHSGAPGYTPFIALVTTNALLRGALRAIAWLQGVKRYETEFFADAPSAIAWLEQRSARTLPLLRRWSSERGDASGTRADRLEQDR